MGHKAVILGTNYYIGLSAIRGLGVYGIYTVAVDYTPVHTYGAKSKYCSERLIAPHYKEDPEGFIRFLIEYAKLQSVPPVLIPCHDNYVEIVDRYLDKLKQYYLIPQTEQGLYTRLMNKESLYRLAEEHGVLVPETIRVTEEHYLDKVDEIIKYPCAVKPVDSPAFMAKFSKKLFMVNNRDELIAAIVKAEEAGFEVIIQRIIPGFDDHMYTFDAYMNQEGKVVHWTTCQKYRQFPINFGASVYTGQKYVPELYDIGAPFFEAIGFKGFAEIEFKKDAETGKFYLIEINVRITNFDTMLHKVGLNMPYITYRELTGSPLAPFAITEDKNVVFRYLYEDILAIRDYVRTKQLTLKEVFLSLFKRKAPAIWNWRDPKPALSFLGIIIGKALAKFKRK